MAAGAENCFHELQNDEPDVRVGPVSDGSKPHHVESVDQHSSLSSPTIRQESRERECGHGAHGLDRAYERATPFVTGQPKLLKLSQF